MHYEVDDIRMIATAFRHAMDSTDFADTQWLRRFPKDACDITCKLLGMHLHTLGVRGISIISGSDPVCSSGQHQWLRCGEIMIDITAYQFERGNQTPVIITAYSPWHETLAGNVFKQLDDDYYQMLTTDRGFEYVSDMYDRIKSAGAPTNL